MEVIGLAASIIAIGQAAEIALKMSRSMRHLARRIRAAKDDIRRFAKDIEIFSSVIGAAHYSLYIHCDTEKTLSPVLQYIEHSKVFDQLVEQSDGVIDYIDELKPRIRSLESRISLKTKLKWVFRRAEVEALGPKMESVKASLNLVMNIVTMEKVAQRDSSGSKEVRREMKRLRRETRHLITQIAELQQVNISQQGWRVQADEKFLKLQEDIRNVLVNLGRSMVHNGTVPEAAHSSVSSATLSDHNDLYNASPRGERLEISQRRPPRELRHAGSPIGFQQTVSHSRESPQQSHSSRSGRKRNIVREVASRQVSPNKGPPQVPLVIPPVPQPGLDPDIQEATVSGKTVSNSSSVSLQEGDFISVAPISYVLHLSQDSAMEAVSGYINNSNGRVFTTALLDKSLERNVISAAFATKNTLVIQNHDEEEEDIWIDFGHGEREKSLGTVTLEWSESAHEGSVRIHCLVYEHNIRDLVFGRPFIQKTKHYWQDGGSMVYIGS